MVNAPYSLLIKSDAVSAGGIRTLADGTPVKPFVRRIGEIGKKYGKVVKGVFKPEYLDLTPDLASHWIETHASMKADGISGKVTKDHLPRDQADSVMGDIEEVFEDGGWVCCLHLVRGADNIKIAEANKDVSLETQREMTSPSGKKYQNFIAAISYVPDPVVTGQPMDAIAASRSYDGDEYTEISASQKDSNMDGLLCGIAKMCGMKEEEVTKDNALEHLGNHMKKMMTSHVAEEEKKASQSSGLNVRYGKRAMATLDPKKFTPAKVKKLTEVLISADGEKPSEIMASMSAQYGDKALDVVEKIVGVLNEDDGGAVKLGEQSGHQKDLTLSRNDGSESKEKKPNPWLTKE